MVKKELLFHANSGGMPAHFVDRKRMESKVVIPPLEGIAAFSIHIHTGTAGHKESVVLIVFVIFSLEPPLPQTVFMKFVEYNKICL